uniref:Alcohol dehydrogenase-like N-terminal domain-containing protein n=1 Tax=Leersia perrieri TaxID=77586 RepID=A0A0D9X6G8_9ORYZ
MPPTVVPYVYLCYCRRAVTPRHEIAGVVTKVGKKVTKFKAGDRVGIGCMDGTVTHGGYSTTPVVHERFVVRFLDSMPLDVGAPLLCAGIMPTRLRLVPLHRCTWRPSAARCRVRTSPGTSLLANPVPARRRLASLRPTRRRLVDSSWHAPHRARPVRPSPARRC